MKRLQIEETQCIDLEMSIDNVIIELTILKAKGWEGISHEYNEDDSDYLVVYRTRLETDDEFNKRKREKEVLDQKKGERDLKEYLRLKNKFEKEAK